jgi:hypothetical protein
MATPLWFEIVLVSSSLSRVSEGNLTVQNGGIRIENIRALVGRHEGGARGGRVLVKRELA